MVKRMHDGENAAMKEFYTLYIDYLTGVCARYIDQDDDLKDVLQDGIVKIITRIREFNYRGPGSLQAWATRIVVNQSLSFLKNRQRNGFASLVADVPDEKEIDDPPIRDVPAEVIHQMVRELPEGYRMVFNLFVFENKSHQEIAQLLGIKKNSSASQLHRAKNLLARKIEMYNHSMEPR